ncbi:MAG: hypothetical protein ABIN58_00900 [candidate division WOR-3 bacterium]
MSKGESRRKTTISRAKTIEGIAAFWDANSLDDYWGRTRSTSFDVRAVRRRRITIAPETYSRIEALARLRGVTAETLVNVWLTERVRTQEDPKETAGGGR